MNNRTIAIIPARGGSKRLLRKNTMEFCGSPMISWTILAAIESQIFDCVLVSTDDEEIAGLAKKFGASVLMRADKLSNDEATLIDVLHHALQSGYDEYQHISLLLANCPLRNSQDIIFSYRDYLHRTPPALLSVVDYGWTPAFRAQNIEKNRLSPIFNQHYKNKGQSFPASVCPSGAIYWSTPEHLAKADSLYIEGIEGFVMPWHRAIDIDTATDFELATFIKKGIASGLQLGGENAE